MAAPPSQTIDKLGGSWTLNKALSTDFNPLMRLQGLTWLSRKAVNLATITTHITLKPSPSEAASSTRTLILNNSAFNFPGTVEARTLDWEWRDFKDYIWGAFQDRSRIVRKDGLAQEVADGEWVQGLRGEDEWMVESEIRARDGAWSNHTVWGFKSVGAERRLIRHMEARRGEECARAVLVYDFVS
ncbi:hypothetical protein BU26DRAFT_515314 [Trematosphaeria pertusa]|uniref:Lipocalin-like domain-containing protein n=1 Tax=Trematosphaeria pertusa TaxID=390896 RepID=A0A6A6IST6_9PLEO|nr:uncharacterized protein BU26DRAFT_515314 [Trematosphaeria pertusa]KAF2252892.1 hypothetical protein BU26DRAFT_515314 [Trematosphaeria pertusa]